MKSYNKRWQEPSKLPHTQYRSCLTSQTEPKFNLPPAKISYKSYSPPNNSLNGDERLDVDDNRMKTRNCYICLIFNSTKILFCSCYEYIGRDEEKKKVNEITSKRLKGLTHML